MPGCNNPMGTRIVAHNIDENWTRHTIKTFWYGHRSFCHRYPCTSFMLLFWLTFPAPDPSEKRTGRTGERKSRVPSRRWISSQHRSCGPWKETAMNLTKRHTAVSSSASFRQLLRLVFSYFYSFVPFSRPIFPHDNDRFASNGLPM